MMDVSPRRKYLAVTVILAFAAATFLGGGYVFGLLTDQEETGASITAASDFEDGSTTGDVTFRGCSEVRFRPADGQSFSATLTLYNSSRDARESVTLTASDAESDANGFRYDSGGDRYEFDVHEYYDSTDGEDKILAVRLDGERFENEHRCADNVETSDSEGSGSTETTTETTTAGNEGTVTTDEPDEEGDDEPESTTTESANATRTTIETTTDDDS